jgi:hypothetical protein
MPAVSWYQATRHTFASHWVMAGGSIEKLREVLGHSSVVVTERYAHLRTDLFGPSDLSRVAVDLSVATGKILPLPVSSHRRPARPDRGQLVTPELRTTKEGPQEAR